MITKNDVKLFEKRKAPLYYAPKNPNLIIESCKRNINPSTVEELVNKWRFISEDASKALSIILDTIEPVIESASEFTKTRLCNLISERIIPSLSNATIDAIRHGEYAFGESTEFLRGPLKESAQNAYDCNRIIANRDKIRNKCDFSDFISTRKSVYQMSEQIFNEYSNVNPRVIYSIVLETLRLETELDSECILSEATEFFKAKGLLTDKDIKMVKEKVCLYESMDTLDKYTAVESVNEYTITKQDVINHIDSLKRNESVKVHDIDTVTDKLLYAPISSIIQNITPYLKFIKVYFIYQPEMEMDKIKICLSRLMDRLKANMVGSDVNRIIVDIKAEQKDAASKIETTRDDEMRTRIHEYIRFLDTIISELNHVADFVNIYDKIISENMQLTDEECMTAIIAIENSISEEDNNTKDREDKEEQDDDEDILDDPEIKGKVNKITNSVKSFSKLAAMNVASVAKNVSAADKRISKTIDTTVSKIEKDIKDSIHNTSKEKVIKGKIIPSASRAIKLAILAGAGWAINPALTIIAALGALGVSKKISKKERMYILDEIDIELKILEKKINYAEMTNDTKELSNLLRLQRSLQRERQRIKYKMKDMYIPMSYSRRD